MPSKKREIEKKIQEEIDGKRDFAAASELVRKLMFLDKFGDEIDSACERLDG